MQQPWGRQGRGVPRYLCHSHCSLTQYLRTSYHQPACQPPHIALDQVHLTPTLSDAVMLSPPRDGDVARECGFRLEKSASQDVQGMTDGSPSRSNSESDQLRLHNGPPNTSSEPASYGHSSHSRYGSFQDRESSQLEPARGKGHQWGSAPDETSGESVPRNCVHPRPPYCLRGRHSDSPDNWNSQDSSRSWVSHSLSTPRASWAAGTRLYCPSRSGLTFLLCVQKLTSPSLPLSNSDTWLAAGIFL